MTTDMSLWQVMQGIKRCLASNDMQEIQSYVETIPPDTLLGEELLTLARQLKEPTVVKFLATLIIHNFPANHTAPKLLDAYLSITKRSLNDGMRVLPSNHVIKVAVQSIIDNQTITPIAYASQNKRSGDNNDWRLAIELCMEKKKTNSASQLVMEFPIKSENLRTWNCIMHSFLSCLKTNQIVDKNEWLQNATLCESMYEKCRQWGLNAEVSNLALAVSFCNFQAAEFKRAIEWANLTTTEGDIVKSHSHISKSYCHLGDLCSAAAALDKLLLQICQGTFNWNPDVESACGETKQQPTFSTSGAEKALLDFQKVLTAHRKKAFLVSGTLLGYARHGSILSHDTDVDVGVIGWEDQFEIAAILMQCGMFKVPTLYLRGKNAYMMTVRHHETNTQIDIFFYHTEGDHLVTGVNSRFGYIQNFRFKKFGIQKIDFLGTVFYAPDDIDLNLTENFGNWRTPDKHYISHLESPSTVDVGGPVYMIVARNELLNALKSKNFIKARRAFNLARSKARPENAISRTLIAQIETSCRFKTSEQHLQPITEEAHCE